MANHSRHRNLLKYLNRLVTGACPPYLLNDRDDIVQTVLIRLDNKLREITEKLEACREALTGAGTKRRSDVASMLRTCLSEIEKSWNRASSARVRVRLVGCLASIGHDAGPRTRREARERLGSCLDWLARRGAREVFAESYIKRGVHWAILDAMKKLACQAEVPAEENEDGSYSWDPPPGAPPWHRNLVLRHEIADCLGQLDDAKRRATFMALLGHEYKEIAAFLNLSVPQADSRIRRGKAFLRKCLKFKGVSP